MGLEQAADSTLYLALRAIIALVVVLASIGLVTYALKRFSGKNILSGSTKSQTISLDILQAKHIDQRRKLVLVKRDQVAHLLLIGGGSDILIEHSIPLEDIDGNLPVVRHKKHPKSSPMKQKPSSTDQDVIKIAQEADATSKGENSNA